MEINPVQPEAATQNTVSSASQISSDFETFLQMLTAQIEYQDPLNPVDSSDYAVQLATFSSVEQQVLTNDLLKILTGESGASNIAQLADWVGKEARSTAPVYFDGMPLTVHPTITTGAERAVMVVKNANGSEVAQTQIQTDGQPIAWAGVSAEGFPFPPGIYSFEVQAYSGEDFLGTTPAETYQPVTEVRRGTDGGTVVVLANQAEVQADDVTALRAVPEQFSQPEETPNDQPA